MGNWATVFSERAIWIAFLVGILATWGANKLPGVFKAGLLWYPRRLWQKLKNVGQHILMVGKAKADPLAAVSYVGRQLALLIVYAAAFLAFLSVIETMQVTHPQWPYAAQRWMIGIMAVLMLACVLRSAAIVFWLIALCQLIVNPPKKDASLKIGPVTLGPSKASNLPTQQASQHAATGQPPETHDQAAEDPSGNLP
jgi:hypothetical protein